MHPFSTPWKYQSFRVLPNMKKDGIFYKNGWLFKAGKYLENSILDIWLGSKYALATRFLAQVISSDHTASEIFHKILCTFR